MKLIFILIISLLTLVSCQKSNDSILEKVILEMDNIKTIKYESTIEIIENDEVKISKRDQIFFDFTSLNSNGLKYHISSSNGELIYNGNESIQSFNDKKLILKDKNPYPNNPILGTLYPLKHILPKLLTKDNIKIIKKESLLNGVVKDYVFTFTMKKQYIDWMEMSISYDIDYDTEFSMIVDALTHLPKKIISQNGRNGAISRTIEVIDVNIIAEDGLWKGFNLPKDFVVFDEDEYNLSLKNKLSSYVGKKMDDWQLPNIENDKIINPSELKGKIVLLEFWFKGCGGCIQAIPGINRIKDTFKDIEIYGIEFIHNSSIDDLRKYVAKSNMNYPTLYNGKSIATNYGIRLAPTFMIIDKNGVIKYAKASFLEEEIISVIMDNL